MIAPLRQIDRMIDHDPRRPAREDDPRSARNAASVIECVTNTTVIRRSPQLAKLLVKLRANLSNAANGSSRSSNFGSVTNALASETAHVHAAGKLRRITRFKIAKPHLRDCPAGGRQARGCSVHPLQFQRQREHPAAHFATAADAS